MKCPGCEQDREEVEVVEGKACLCFRCRDRILAINTLANRRKPVKEIADPVPASEGVKEIVGCEPEG